MTGAPPRLDDVRPLRPDEAAALLARMGVADPGSPTPKSADLLARLQWRFLCASPFHNIELLAGTSPRTVEAAIGAVVAGRGGTCHVQATGFLALLRGLGFDAHLAAATIREPGDHLVVLASADGRRWVCDVGNGHPYRRPFPLDGACAIEHVGWRFSTLGDGRALELKRSTATRTWTVYRVDPAPRSFADFRGIIDGHHTKRGFGPFLTGLRAVRIDDDRLVTLRDLALRRYSVAGQRIRPVPDLAAAGRVLTDVFDFEPALVEAALARVAPHAIGWAPAARRPLSVAVTVASDRAASLRRLLADLAADAAGVDPAAMRRLRVFVLDNGADGSVSAAVAAAPVGLDVRLIDDPAPGRRCIAESRLAQARAVARAVAAGEAIDAVWMLDDDLRLVGLERRAGRLVRTAAGGYLADIVERWWRRPEVSLLVGGVTGDPPIRPDAVHATQLLDLAANLDRFAGLDPDAPYAAPDQTAAFELPDYYYDHARTDGHVDQPFYWLPREAGATTRAAARRFVDAMAHVFAGKTPTRPLTGGGGVPAGRRWLRRGGNAVFLDLDSALRHPYPSLAVGGQRTRRADMVGTALLAREGGAPAVGWDRAVLHDRPPRRPGPLAAAVLATMSAEFYGVLLARALVEGEVDLDGCARRRARRIIERIALSAARLDAARAAVERARAGWLGADEPIAGGLDRLDAMLREGATLYTADWPAAVKAAIDAPAHVERVRRFVAHELDSTVAAQRRAIAAAFDEEA